MNPWQGTRPPRKWQRECLPIAIDAARSGDAAVISAVTGAGKSTLIAELCAMALPMTQERGHRVVVSTPTQSLVSQLSETIAARVGWVNVGQFYGKRKQPERAIVVTCTPSVGNLGEAIKGTRASLLVCDEAHKTEGGAIKAAIKALRPAARLGFSATPYRADEGETLELWDRVAYQYTLADAWRDGVLVPFEPVHWEGKGTANTDQVCLDMARTMTGPGVFSAMTIPDAEGYAQWLTGHGFASVAVHSKLKPARIRETIQRLQRGELRAVVHVSMLSEGVDLPWLRWICLRRPVGSRVRFVQEVGRVLRVMPEADQWGPKSLAYVLDPHALFMEHGITNPAALGEPAPKPPKGPTLIGRLPGEPKGLKPATRVDAASAWARRLLLVMQAGGMAAETPSQHVDGQWRQKRASEKSVAALGRMKWACKYLPPGARKSGQWMCTNAHALRGGAVSDLLGVLLALADEGHRYFAWPTSVAIPALEF